MTTNLYKINLKKLTEANAYYPSLEHDACGVGLVASIEGKKSRKASYSCFTRKLS